MAIGDVALAEPDAAWLASVARALGRSAEDFAREIGEPLPGTTRAEWTQVDRQTGRIIGLQLARRLDDLQVLPDPAPLTGLIVLGVHDTRLERLDLSHAHRLEVLNAADTPLADLALPTPPSRLRWLDVRRTRLRELDLSAATDLDLEWDDAPLERVRACDITLQVVPELGALDAVVRPATAAELHAFADDFNFDDQPETLRWIVGHAACDLGTALLVYWRCDPSDDPDHPFRAVLEDVAARAATTGFATATCAYDPVSDRFGARRMDDPSVPVILRRSVP